jgi:hypothetical protein
MRRNVSLGISIVVHTLWTLFVFNKFELSFLLCTTIMHNVFQNHLIWWLMVNPSSQPLKYNSLWLYCHSTKGSLIMTYIIKKSHMLLQPKFSHSYFNLLSFLLYKLINCKCTNNVHQLHHKKIPISTHLQQYLPHVAHNTLILPLNWSQKERWFTFHYCSCCKHFLKTNKLFHSHFT